MEVNVRFSPYLHVYTYVYVCVGSTIERRARRDTCPAFFQKRKRKGHPPFQDPVREAENGAKEAATYSLKAVRPVKAAALSAWYLCAFAGELAAFAVVSTTLHPIATVPGYLLGAVANGAAQWWSGERGLDGGNGVLKATGLSCISVALAMAGGQTMTFTKSRTFGGRGLIPALFILIRFGAWAALCCIDLPQGLLPIGSLGRPMGFPVLRAKFLEPAAAFREAAVCFASRTWMTEEAEEETEANSTLLVFKAEVGFGECGWPATDELNTPSTIFNSSLWLLVVVLVPLHMCIVVTLLALNRSYACGAEDIVAKQEIAAKQSEIDEFARRNEQTAGQHTQLSLVAE